MFWNNDNRRLVLARDVYSRLNDKTRCFAFVTGLIELYYFLQLLMGYLANLQHNKLINLHPESIEIMSEVTMIFILISLTVVLSP